MGIKMDGPALFYDNILTASRNAQNPEFTLKKKNQSIAYHATRHRDC
jgi:hypothetical protein